MIRRNTWILLAVFAVVLVAALYLQRSGRLEPEAEAATPTSEPQLLNLSAEDIRSLRIEDSQGKVVALERNEQGGWVVTEPTTEAADAAQVEPAISSLATLSVLNRLESSPALDVIGLNPPAYTLMLGLTDGRTHTFQVGAETPTATGYYASLDGGAPVVVSKFSVDTVVNLLQEPPGLATETPTPGEETPTESATVEAGGTPTAEGTAEIETQTPGTGTPTP